MNPKKVIICDLDGTLAESKSPLSNEMSEILRNILSKHYLAVVSGGSFTQFQTQFLSHLNASPEQLSNLYIFPTMGGTCYVYDKENNNWKQVYEEVLTLEERTLIKTAINEMVTDESEYFKDAYGELIDDRITQITLSAKGQDAPLSIKEGWDTNQAKRGVMIEMLREKIPQFEIRIGGTTSIDITKKGIDKAFAVEKLKSIINVQDEDMIFLGDAMYDKGNDSPVKRTGVDYIQTAGPNEAINALRQYL